MKRSEKSIQNETLIGLSARPKSIYWRNNTGQAWQGREIKKPVGSYIKVEPGMVILAEARPVKFGLPGSGDILGVDDGRPVAAEAKTEDGRQAEQQARFQTAWEKAGGIYILFRSPEEALEKIESLTKIHRET